MTTLALPRIAGSRKAPPLVAVHVDRPSPVHDRSPLPWLLVAIAFAPLVLLALIVCVAADVDLGGAS